MDGPRSEPIATSTTWQGLHFTCTADQAMWLYLALHEARAAVAKRPHTNGQGTPSEQMLESADQWDFYDRMAKRCSEYAHKNQASLVGLRFPEGRPYRLV
jgi:hypothetical protein